MSEVGTLLYTRERFNDEITAFVTKSDALNENWCIREHKSTSECKYLVKRQTNSFFGPCEQDVESENIGDCEDELSGLDFSVCASDVANSAVIVTYEYHAVYSPSYSVPVLYFNAWMQDGKLLTLEQIWNQVSQMHQHFLRHDKWSFITQQEHPLLNRPFFSVHPCHTADFMKLLRTETLEDEKRTCSYVITWLSAVGPTVGLELPLQFAVGSEQC